MSVARSISLVIVLAGSAACAATPQLEFRDDGADGGALLVPEGGSSTPQPGADGSLADHDATTSPGKDASAAPDAVPPKDAAGGDAQTGGTCSLPNGATACCGTVACKDNGGSCSSHCLACQQCAGNTQKPVCCAKGALPIDVSCEATPDDC